MQSLPALTLLLLVSAVSALQLQDDRSSTELPLHRVKRQFGAFGPGAFQRFPQNPGRYPQAHPGRRPHNPQGSWQPQNFPQPSYPGYPGYPGNPNVPHQPPQTFQVTTPQTFIRGPFGYVPANQGNQGNQGHGNNNPNCRGNRRYRPECQGAGTTSGNQSNHPGQGHGPPDCRGKKKNRPECNVNTEPLHDQKVIVALQDISWLARLTPDNRSLGIPNLPDTPSAQAQSRNFLLGVNQPDTPFQECATPRRQRGHCRYLQHCILQDFVNSFNVFLQYVCFIEGTYVGVCCPDSRYPQSTTSTTSSTTTTTTRRPTLPPTAFGCGLNAKEQVRIVGGRDADTHEWPWMAALLRTGSTQYCGGVLISDRHVLTAAHCVEGFTADSITVRLGEYNFDENDETSTLDYKPSSIQKHLGYNTTTFVNDIAILSLPQPVTFNTDVRPVCLPTPGPIYEAEEPTVTGWGTIYYGGPVSQTLQEVTIPVWNNKDCDDTYEQTIVDTVLCAGAKTGGKDSCQGDSGGPLLLQQGVERRWTVIGVVSWGIRCAEPGFPGVYTRVNRYLDWIQANSI